MIQNRAVIEAAILAPSPDNNQPWRFVGDCPNFRVKENGTVPFDVGGTVPIAFGKEQLQVYLDPQRALPSDVNAMFDLVGLGAAVENACIAARQQGFEPSVEYSEAPDWRYQNGDEPAARIAFHPGGRPDPLFPHLGPVAPAEGSIRPSPSPRTLCSELRRRRQFRGDCPYFAAIGTVPQRRRGVQLDWLVDPANPSFLAIIAVSDRFRFEYEPFHNEVFRQLRFSAEEAERTRDGLDVRTLELPPGAAFLLRQLRPWRRMRWIHRLGLVGLLTLPSILSVRKSGAIGILSVPEPTVRQWLQGGRAFQRIWLAAQAEGLSLQPLGSLPIFIAQMEQYEGRNLTPQHQEWATPIARRCTDLLPSTAERVILIAFRLGYSAPPHQRSLRRAVTEVAEKRFHQPKNHEESPRESATAAWSYEEAFQRNRGLISPEEQEKLRNSRVAIAGMGGVGGIHLETLARLGIGRFTIADPDVFEVANTNRQVGATCSTMGRSKAEVMAEIARDINPEVDIRIFSDPIDAENADEFLSEADLFIDGVDFFSIGLRRMLFQKAAEHGLYSITAGPIGLSTAWLIFSPTGMSFDRYFDLHDGMDQLDSLIAFAVGVAPPATQIAYMDLKKVNIGSRTGPSTSAACQLCAGVASIEALKILIDRGSLRPALWYFQFDAYRGILRQGYLRWGNRGPIQRIKRAILRNRMIKLIRGNKERIVGKSPLVP